MILSVLPVLVKHSLTSYNRNEIFVDSDLAQPSRPVNVFIIPARAIEHCTIQKGFPPLSYLTWLPQSGGMRGFFPCRIFT
jgi:hypothetical protein